MKVLLTGSGGREHALAWKLAEDVDVIVAPGNPGIAEVARCMPVPAGDLTGQVEIAKAEKVDLAVIGPEDPLIAGLADLLRAAGIPTFGPGAAAAQLEGSKAWAKELMADAGVPTAAFQVFTHPEPAHLYASAMGERGLVVKASGAALGKGVVVCDRAAEAHEAIDAMLVDRAHGSAGDMIVIEDRLSGPEFSLMTLCSDGDLLSLPVAQDYKRALEGDRGPNTGGMGSVSPAPWADADLVRRTEDRVVRPILAALSARGLSYRGVLFSGLILHEGEPHCLEFNVRFGDPETQSIMLRLGRGLPEALLACAVGEPISAVEVLDNAVVTVVLASGGYPGSIRKGLPITVGRVAEGVQLFHAGTALEGGQMVTAGGRVLAVTAAGMDIAQARETAYEAIRQVSFEGMRYRMDIAGQPVGATP